MALKITQRTSGNVAILDLAGTLMLEDTTLRPAMTQLHEASVLNIVLNLGGLMKMDSAGLGELVSAYTTAANRGSKVKLSNVPAKVHDLLMITQLITVFEIFDNETAAVASFP